MKSRLGVFRSMAPYLHVEGLEADPSQADEEREHDDDAAGDERAHDEG